MDFGQSIRGFNFHGLSVYRNFEITLKDITKDTVAMSRYGSQHVEMC